MDFQTSFDLGDYVKVKRIDYQNDAFQPHRPQHGQITAVTAYLNGLVVYCVDSGNKAVGYYAESQLEADDG